MDRNGCWRFEYGAENEQSNHNEVTLKVAVDLSTSYSGIGMEPGGFQRDASIKNIDNLFDDVEGSVNGETGTEQQTRASVIGRGYSLDSALRIRKGRKCRMFGEFWIDQNESAKSEEDNEFEDDLDQFQRYSTDLFTRFVPFRLLRSYVDAISKIKPFADNSEGLIKFQNPDIFTGALLFADISQFSKLTRSYVRDYDRNVVAVNTRAFAAESLWKYLNNNVFKEVTKLISKRGGDVLKFVGDGIMAAFPLENFGGDKALTVSTCIQVALEILQIDTSNVHCGIGYGEISCYLVGGVGNRVEYFISGDPLKQAIDTEKASSIIYKQNRIDQKIDGSRRVNELKVTRMPIGISQSAMQCIPQYKRKKVFQRWKDKTGSGLADCYYIRKAKEKFFKDVSLDGVINPLGSDNHLRLQNLKLDVEKKLNEEQRLLLKTITSLHGPKTMQTYVKLAGSEKWSPELRVCTSMFVKLDGIQDGQALNNEELEVIQAAVSEVQYAVARYGGTFLRFVVDDKGAILFTAFGLPPRKFDEDNIRAATCALEIHQRIVQLRKDVKQKNAANELARDLGVSIGITSGKVFCGIVGGQNRCEYTIHGESVNFANNLMAHASAKLAGGADKVRILVGTEVKDQVDPIIQVGPSIKLKDHIREKNDGDGTAHTILRKKLRNMKKQYLQEYSPPQSELTRLQKEQLEKVTLSKNQLLVVRGEFGSGKTYAIHILGSSLVLGSEVVIAQGGWFDRYQEYHILKHVLLQIGSTLLSETRWPDTEEDAKKILEKLFAEVNIEDELEEAFFDQSFAFQMPNSSDISSMMKVALERCIEMFFKTGKKRLAILIDDWDHVHSHTRDLLWNAYKDFKERGMDLTLVVTCDRAYNDVVSKHAEKAKCLYDMNPLSVEEVTMMLQKDDHQFSPKTIDYLQEMGSGNPRHIKDLVHILTDLDDWFIGGNKETQHAWGMMSDRELQYADFVTRTITKEQKVRKSVDVHSGKARQTSVRRQATVTSFMSMAGGFTANIQTAHHDIKINEYFDSNIYPTTSILTAKMDTFSPMQHMTIKISATLGLRFSSKLLLAVLQNMDDKVHALFEEDSRLGTVKAVAGPTKLLKNFLENALIALEKGGIMEKTEENSDAYCFRNILMRETAYQLMPHHLRVYIHSFAVQNKDMNYACFNDEVEQHKFVAHHAYELSKFLLHQCYDFDAYEHIFEAGLRSLHALEEYTVTNGYSKYLYFSLRRLTEWETRFVIIDQVNKTSIRNSKRFHDWYNKSCGLEQRALTCRRMAQYFMLAGRAESDPVILLNDALDLLSEVRLRLQTHKDYLKRGLKIVQRTDFDAVARVELEYLYNMALLLHYQVKIDKIVAYVVQSKRVRTLEQWRNDTDESRKILERARKSGKLSPIQIATYAYCVAVIEWRTMKQFDKFKLAIIGDDRKGGKITNSVKQILESIDVATDPNPYLLQMMAQTVYTCVKALKELIKKKYRDKSKYKKKFLEESRAIVCQSGNTFREYLQLWIADTTFREGWFKLREGFYRMLQFLDFPEHVLQNYHEQHIAPGNGDIQHYVEQARERRPR